MPGIYAHYRMGVELLPTLPGDTARTISRFRRLFEVGLHGPDMFFYYNPVLPTSVGALGSKFHAQDGKTFFLRICRLTRMERSEAAQSYLYGVLCHYVLDSVLHPFVNEKAKELGIPHGEIEAEFDRFLLEKDGKNPPESQDLSGHLKLTPGECATVAKFYPPATARQVQDSLRNMAAAVKLFAVPEGARRTVLRTGMQAVKLPARHLLMTTGENMRCSALDEPLFALYTQALEEFPELLRQVQANLTYNGGFDEKFDKIFG
ncbi:MAG: hypothetical protein E7447_04590 [Ruminococcaceae bacterium]|nr:hypothetical protein [Oscillospiraceae bacterium]